MRPTTQLTADRDALLVFVRDNPGLWGHELGAALGWDEDRLWEAIKCPLFDDGCGQRQLPAGYRLTKAGVEALAGIAERAPAWELQRQAMEAARREKEERRRVEREERQRERERRNREDREAKRKERERKERIAAFAARMLFQKAIEFVG